MMYHLIMQLILHKNKISPPSPHNSTQTPRGAVPQAQFPPVVYPELWKDGLYSKPGLSQNIDVHACFSSKSSSFFQNLPSQLIHYTFFSLSLFHHKVAIRITNIQSGL